MTDRLPDGGWPGATHYKVHSANNVEVRGPGLWGYYNPIAKRIEGERFSKRLWAELAKADWPFRVIPR